MVVCIALTIFLSQKNILKIKCYSAMLEEKLQHSEIFFSISNCCALHYLTVVFALLLLLLISSTIPFNAAISFPKSVAVGTVAALAEAGS